MALDLVKYLRIKYKHLGRGFVEGDCLNLGLLFYKEEFGKELEAIAAFTDYSENWAKEGQDFFLKLYKNFGFKKVKDDYRYGDVLFVLTGSAVSHIGIVVDPEQGYFIHTTKLGTAVHNYMAGEWATRIHSAVRYKGKLHAN